jgi:hypothetical protein
LKILIRREEEEEEEEEEKEEFCWLGTLAITALWASFCSLRKSALTLSKTSTSTIHLICRLAFGLPRDLPYSPC